MSKVIKAVCIIPLVLLSFDLFYVLFKIKNILNLFVIPFSLTFAILIILDFLQIGISKSKKYKRKYYALAQTAVSLMMPITYIVFFAAGTINHKTNSFFGFTITLIMLFLCCAFFAMKFFEEKSEKSKAKIRACFIIITFVFSSVSHILSFRIEAVIVCCASIIIMISFLLDGFVKKDEENIS